MLNVNYHSIILFFFVFLFCSCEDASTKGNFSKKSPPKSRIKLDNKVREEIGIRKVKDNWYFYGKNFNAEIWKPDPSAYACKKVQFIDNNKIKWEEDYYYTGKTFLTIDGTSWEKLTIGYDYPPVSKIYIRYTGENPKFEKLVEPYNDGTTDFKSAYEAADIILKSWKMSRL